MSNSRQEPPYSSDIKWPVQHLPISVGTLSFSNSNPITAVYKTKKNGNDIYIYKMPFLQRVRAELRLWKPPAPQEVMCYIIWVHVWVGTRSSGQHLPYQNTKGPLHQRGREESLQELSGLSLLTVSVEQLPLLHQVVLRILTTSDLEVNFWVCRLSMAIHLTGSFAFLWFWTL